MNNRITSSWASLRYLAVIPLIILGALSILATGGGGGSSPPPADAGLMELLATDLRFLYQVDPSSGASLRISGTQLRGFSGVSGLAFDPNTDTLYGTDAGQLITIDPVTGAGTAIGALGFTNVNGLAFDPNSACAAS